MQPVVARRFFGNDMLGGIGTLARALAAAPDSAAGTRAYREPPAHFGPVLDAYDSRMIDFLGWAPRTAPEEPDVLDPVPMGLHQGVRRAWIVYHNLVESQLRPGARLAPIRAFGSKLAEHAGRLAAVLTLYGDPDATEVSRDCMAAGMMLAEHYAEEMLRLHGAAGIKPELEAAYRLLRWWQDRREPVLHLAAIYQLGPSELRSAEAARKAVAVLEDHGWVRRLPTGTAVGGLAHKDVWELLP